MNNEELTILQNEFEYRQPRTKESVVSEIDDWAGGDPEGVFDYAVEKGFIKKSGKDIFGDDLWRTTK